MSSSYKTVTPNSYVTGSSDVSGRVNVGFVVVLGFVVGSSTDVVGAEVGCSVVGSLVDGPQAVKPKIVVNANKLNNFFIVLPPILNLDQSNHNRNKVSSMNL